MKLIGMFLMGACMSLSLLSCSKKDEAKPEKEIKIPFSGAYSWHFEIPGMGGQTSTHIFYPDSIQYEMTGAAYSTTYTQTLVSYDTVENRCITIGKGGSISKDGVYFVMFFKDATESSITIYKHECAGKKEAESFPYPEPGATEDHGWNVYHKVE